MAAQTTWFLTAASRGIGLEVARQLSLVPTNTVVATCRNPAKAEALQALKASAKGTMHILPLDIATKEGVEAVLEPLKAALGAEGGIDYLVNIAAITEGDDTAFAFSYDGFMASLQTNVVGPAHLTQVLLPYLQRGSRKVVVNYTSGLASIALDYGPKNATYSISKTAVNMLTYKQAKERPDMIVITVDPGWVKTDMGGPNAMLFPHESVEGVLKTVAGLLPSDSGKFYRYDGQVLPW